MSESREGLTQELLAQADRHTACGKNCQDAKLLREAAQSLDALSRREQQMRELVEKWRQLHLVSDSPWPDYGECAKELSALLGDRETRDERA
jgi:hypothetical protein